MQSIKHYYEYTNSSLEEKFEKEINGRFADNDVWQTNWDEFVEYRNSSNPRTAFDFSMFPPGIKEEMKLFTLHVIRKKYLSVKRFYYDYAVFFEYLATFIKKFYQEKESLASIPIKPALLLWQTYVLTEVKNSRLRKKYKQAVRKPLYVIRELDSPENVYSKDLWDVEKILPPGKMNNRYYNLKIDFTKTPSRFKEILKNYIKVKIGTHAPSTCIMYISRLNTFFNFIAKRYEGLVELYDLKREHIEEYLTELRESVEKNEATFISYVQNLKCFIEYLTICNHPRALELDVDNLIYDEDIPRRVIDNNRTKYIPKIVLDQLDEYLDQIKPKEYIPIVILLRATGWRISDILNLRYDNCLQQTNQGWYICGNIPKTQVINHRVPITDDVADVVKVCIERAEEINKLRPNPYKFLLIKYEGRGRGNVILHRSVNNVLNDLASKKNIVDDMGNIFHFNSHAFRHTKAVELINNGMNLLHVQKWLAHCSSSSTLIYAKIHDRALKESWANINKQGLIKFGPDGTYEKLLPDNLKDDYINWEYIRNHLDAVRVPLGYCMKPRSEECLTQLIPCLDCRNLCTTAEFIPQYESDIDDIHKVIERGRLLGRTLWVEKNQILLERYQSILKVLKENRTHHIAGKHGREYIGEERKSGKA